MFSFSRQVFASFLQKAHINSLALSSFLVLSTSFCELFTKSSPRALRRGPIPLGNTRSSGRTTDTARRGRRPGSRPDAICKRSSNVRTVHQYPKIMEHMFLVLSLSESQSPQKHTLRRIDKGNHPSWSSSCGPVLPHGITLRNVVGLRNRATELLWELRSHQHGSQVPQYVQRSIRVSSPPLWSCL